ncbi:hypothetical protein D9M69_57630 [compost metagenome]
MPCEEQELLETELVELSFEFIRTHHAARDPELAERLQKAAVRERGELLLRDIVLMKVAAAFEEHNDDVEVVRQEAHSAHKLLTEIRDRMEKIPENVRARLDRHYTDRSDPSFFSFKVENALEEAIRYYARQSRAERGRKADLTFSLVLSQCVKALQYLVGRNFIRNFDTHKAGETSVFLHPDCMFCEMVLKRLDPTLSHEQVRSSLKTHFAKNIRKTSPTSQ